MPVKDTATSILGPSGEIELRPVETSTTDADGCVLVDMGTMTLMNRTDEKKTDSGVAPSLGADREEMALKMNCVAHIDLLGRFRTLISICSMCSEGASDTMSEYASLRSGSTAADLEKLGSMADEIDSISVALSKRTLYKNHAKASRVAMLQAVCMLACSYSRGLIGEYSVQEPSDVTTGDGMFSGTINPAKIQ